MILGHIPATALTARLVLGRWPSLALIMLLAFIPDVLDKGIYLVLGFKSRGYFHSVPVVLALTCCLWAASRISKPWRGVPFLVGACWLVHIGCDFVTLQVLIWPFAFTGGKPGFWPMALDAGAFDGWNIVRRFYLEMAYPWWLALEGVITVSCLVLWLRDRRPISPR